MHTLLMASACGCHLQPIQACWSMHELCYCFCLLITRFERPTISGHDGCCQVDVGLGNSIVGVLSSQGLASADGRLHNTHVC